MVYFLRPVLSLLVGILLLFPQVTAGQDQIIPDTLDNRRYYPLEVGNEWQITQNAFASAIQNIRRTRILSDTLVAGRQYFKSKFELYNHAKFLEYERGSWLRYNEAGAVLSFNAIEHDTIAVDSTLYWYHANFKDSVDLDLFTKAFVDGRYDTTITFPGPVPVAVAAVKELFAPDPLTGMNYYLQEVYAADIGLVKYEYFDGPTGSLSFARIGDIEYGTSVIKEDQFVNPENWFPLQVGNYWHYQYDIAGHPLIDDIKKATRDTLIGNDRWVAIQNVACAPAPQFCPPQVTWYRFTEDHYLRRSGQPGLSQQDTVAATVPTSIFVDTITHKRDTLRYPLGSSNIIVGVVDNRNGTEQDSTHWRLLAYNTSNALQTWSYVYKVGEAEGLVGAIIGELEYGDVTRLNEIIRVGVEKETPREALFHIDVYPNPASAHLVIQTSHKGVVEVFDMLGRQIETIKIDNPGAHRLNVSDYASGLYLIRSGIQIRRVIVL